MMRQTRGSSRERPKKTVTTFSATTQFFVVVDKNCEFSAGATTKCTPGNSEKMPHTREANHTLTLLVVGCVATTTTTIAALSASVRPGGERPLLAPRRSEGRRRRAHDSNPLSGAAVRGDRRVGEDELPRVEEVPEIAGHAVDVVLHLHLGAVFAFVAIVVVPFVLLPLQFSAVSLFVVFFSLCGVSVREGEE